MVEPVSWSMMHRRLGLAIACALFAVAPLGARADDPTPLTGPQIYLRAVRAMHDLPRPKFATYTLDIGLFLEAVVIHHSRKRDASIGAQDEGGVLMPRQTCSSGTGLPDLVRRCRFLKMCPRAMTAPVMVGETIAD